MDLMKMGKDLLGDKLGDSGVMDALSGLTGGEGFDIGAITEKLKAGGLGDKLESWMGDGENAAVSGEELTSALGDAEMGEVASKLGVEKEAAAEKLSELMPSLVDKMSSGGSLLDSVTGGGNPLDMAKNLFNK